ncbi:MAG: hypothetical protein GF421_13460 [Candidatus Aminicenantes bacterium]|nr:hypothetical protein [Candidatus Aminicenantes bacterium]
MNDLQDKTKHKPLHRIPSLILGFLALSLQVLLLREFSVMFAGNEITFGILLGAWLFWTGMGSLFGSVFQYSIKRFLWLYFGVIFIAPWCFLGLRFIRFLFHAGPGEIMGILPMILSALLVTFLVCFPLGVLFVFNTKFLKGHLSTVYLMESIGSALGGLLVYFALIPTLSNWKAAGLISAVSAVIIFMISFNKKHIFPLMLVLLTATVLWTTDSATQKLYWEPFVLTASKDSPYGKIQMVQTKEQKTLYNNHSKVYSYPNLAAAEEAVHFTLLQNPKAEKVLLIGGGLAGSLQQILKYPLTQIHYVELDPEIIRMSLSHLPEAKKLLTGHPRIQVFFEDGRVFLKNTQTTYDIIILNLPPPETVQLNRFYTQEFFQIIQKKLNQNGVFSFQVPSAENYISPQLQDFLSCLFFTLKSVFQDVNIVPGASNIFLASSRLPPLDAERLSRKIIDLDLNNTYVSPYLLMSRLSPLRIESLREKIAIGEKRINKDLYPISYFTNSLFQSTQFRGIETKVLSFLSQISRFWLLDFPLLLFVIVLSVIALKNKPSLFYLFPLALIGLTSIAVEIIVIIAYQIIYGYLYQSVSLLFACFMAGMALGAWIGTRMKNIDIKHLIIIQFQSLVLLIGLLFSLKHSPPQLFFFLFLVLMGSVGGEMFIISNQLYLKKNLNYGLGYGIDLLGSFLGALLLSSILIPLVGLPHIIQYLILAGSFCFLLLIWGQRQNFSEPTFFR